MGFFGSDREGDNRRKSSTSHQRLVKKKCVKGKAFVRVLAFGGKRRREEDGNVRMRKGKLGVLFSMDFIVIGSSWDYMILGPNF